MANKPVHLAPKAEPFRDFQVLERLRLISKYMEAFGTGDRQR